MAPLNGDTLKRILKLHPAVLIISLFLLFLIVGLFIMMYLRGTGFSCGLDGKKISCEFGNESTPEEKRMTGYFYTLDDKGGTVCVSENIVLKFYEDKATIEGHSSGEVHSKGGMLISKQWLLSGFRHGNDLSLAYTTDSNLRTGAGVYYPMEMGEEYAGYWLGLDFPLGHKVQCPALLTPNKKQVNETCEQRWPRVFTGNPCVILEEKGANNSVNSNTSSVVPP